MKTCGLLASQPSLVYVPRKMEDRISKKTTVVTPEGMTDAPGHPLVSSVYTCTYRHVCVYSHAQNKLKNLKMTELDK